MATTDIAPLALRCEYLTDPLGIDALRPRLSWALASERRGQSQTAYHILVASAPELLEEGKADLWDTAKVQSDRSIQVEYDGKPLASAMRCLWKVRVWDSQGQASPWSRPASWEMGLLKPEDWTGWWINDAKPLPAADEEFYKDDPAPLFRKDFQLSKPLRRARLYISGLGYYEASLNGARVGDRLLDPGWTNYSKRVLYSTYDITDQLRSGTNCLGVMLGNGWYNPLPMRLWGKLNLRQHLPTGRPRFIAQLNVEYTDGTRAFLVSDGTWKVADGPILRNNVYLGETYDARRQIPGWDQPGFDDRAWRPVALAREAVGGLHAQMQPPIKLTATLKPIAITQPAPGTYILDLGQNFAGTVRLRARGPAGTAIKLRYGELLHPDGTLNVLTSTCGQIKPPDPDQDRERIDPALAWNPAAHFGPGAPPLACQSDTFILKGDGDEVYTPRFTFHGFRYVEITGFPGAPTLQTLEGLRLSAAVERAGSFECSNELFNRIQKTCQWTFLSNLFGVQSDCPHREKFGYGGDIVPTSDAFLLNFDMAAFYTKVLRDFADAARPKGGMTETAPYVGIADFSPGDQSGPVGWQLAHPLLQWKLYQYCGDIRLIQEQYPATRRLVEFLRSAAKDHILDTCLGDHESLDPKPTALTTTAFYYHHALLLSQFATLLAGEGEAPAEPRTRKGEAPAEPRSAAPASAPSRQEYLRDAAEYTALAEQIKTAFIAHFHKGDGRFDIATQAAQATALHYDLIPPAQRQAALAALVDEVANKHAGHIRAGIFGTRFVLDVLSTLGRADLAYTIANQKTFPGWGHMLQGGATTLWETWAFSDNVYSHNHPMFGSISAWLFESIAGLRPDPQAKGFDRLIIRPAPVGGLQWARATHESLRGPVAVDWRQGPGQFHLTLTLPPGVTATVYIPTTDPAKVTETGQPATQARGVTFLRAENGTALYRVTSGRYSFASPIP